MENNNEALMERIHNIAHRLGKIFEASERKSTNMIKGLSRIEISLMIRLFKNPQIIMRELSEALHVSRSSMTGLVDHLEELGYLRRVTNRSDRRSFVLELTEAGKLAVIQHEEYERKACLQFIKAMQMCDISEDYLDHSVKLLDFLEQEQL